MKLIFFEIDAVCEEINQLFNQDNRQNERLSQLVKKLDALIEDYVNLFEIKKSQNSIVLLKKDIYERLNEI